MVRVLALLLGALGVWAIAAWCGAVVAAVRHPAQGLGEVTGQWTSLLGGAAMTAGLIRIWLGRHLRLQEIRRDHRVARDDIARVVVDLVVVEAALRTVQGRSADSLERHLRELSDRAAAMQAEADDWERRARWPGWGDAARMAARRDAARGLRLRAEALRAGSVFDPRSRQEQVRAVWDDVVAPVLLTAAPLLESAEAVVDGHAAMPNREVRPDEDPLPLSEAGRERIRVEAERLRGAVEALAGASAELGAGWRQAEFADHLRRAEGEARAAAQAILDVVEADDAVRSNVRAAVLEDIRRQAPADPHAETWRAVRDGAGLPSDDVAATVLELQRAHAALAVITDSPISHYETLVSLQKRMSLAERDPLMRVGSQTNLWEEAATGWATGRRVLELCACCGVFLATSLPVTVIAALISPPPVPHDGTEPFGTMLGATLGVGAVLLHILVRTRSAQVGGLLAAQETSRTLSTTRRRIQQLMLGLDEQRIGAVAVLGRRADAPAQESDQRVYEEALAEVWRVSEDVGRMPRVDRRRRVGRRRVEHLERAVAELDARGVDVRARVARALVDEPMSLTMP